MSPVLDLVRDDLRDFAGYSSARRTTVSGSIWLNANESPWVSPADPGLALNRYPEPQPVLLRERLARLYGVATPQLLITRGSDEGIDLLVRAFCRAGQDGVLIAPPTFGMYAVCARVQNAPLHEVALIDDGDRWSLDVERVIERVATQPIRLVFLCSPANPTGQALPTADIRRLALALRGRAVLVIDEAYAEFSPVDSAIGLLAEFDHLVVLRTLSKAYALAGARVGSVIAAPDLIGVLRNLAAPYPVPAPSAALALAALEPEAAAAARSRVQTTIAERGRVETALRSAPGVTHVYASAGNYLLLRFQDAEAAFQRLLAAGVVVRDMRANPVLADALRISIGSPAENEALIAALATLKSGRAA
ncbi:histidinol-phosphate transaminase [Arenimonas oryziterrae]|uniref:Histidinol-phosphate aminotransferase n=1 Tax=Arenimonas oryziterrae DSM 21050 = YC6267 TaxID=1121015 RepID=A0A091ALM9_9GAMM|nr:histidinol-phosphate transaminase [Arenimonas oryziterrae]KFN41093.1 hypothetical protein N789_04190 [Arenimonas oryziterrae DSM 21050 = YC6267]